VNPSLGLLALAFSLSVGVSGVRSPEVAQIYERSITPTFHGHFAVRPLSFVGVGLQFSYGVRTGTGVQTQSLAPASEEAKLHTGTFGLRVEGRFETSAHQPVVPYAVAGPLFTFYRESVGATQVSGGKPGALVGFGLAFLLTPETSWSMQPRPRLDGVYLVVEGGHRWAKWASGEGLDLGGWHVHAGVEVAVR